MDEQPGLEEWFNQILKIHGKPCNILIRVDEDGYHLVAGANDLVGMGIVLSKKDLSYVG